MRNGCLAWNCILVLGCFSTLIGRTAAQDTSTPEERAQWVEITHKLESAPLDDNVNKQGEGAFKRLSDVGGWPTSPLGAGAPFLAGLARSGAWKVARNLGRLTPLGWR
jgi:hypothetical protein